jgi:hypothetical protein
VYCREGGHLMSWAQRRQSCFHGSRRLANAAAPDSEEAAAKEPGDKPSGGPKPVGAPSGGINRPNVQATPPGSMDRVSMTDPIWDFGGTQTGPISVKRLSGEVDGIDPSTDEPDDADLKPGGELRINEVTTGARSELRSEIETIFQWSRAASAPRRHSGVQTLCCKSFRCEL